MAEQSALYLGLMSGTSADGIDAALVRFNPHCELVYGCTYPWDTALRQQLIPLIQGGEASIDTLGQLNVQVALAFSQAALRLIDEAQVNPAHIRAIGSHGQTIRHRPQAAFPFSWQIGGGNYIAEHTGILTVADFRSRDVAAGGQGAPLVPAFHAALLRQFNEERAVLNLGGIANFTLLPIYGEVRGFDTGPANALLDAWCQHSTGNSIDIDGALARQGTINHTLLSQLLSDPWFSLPPPKSTGREQFHLPWLQAQLSGNELIEDVQTTLLELSAITISDALLAQQPNTTRVLVCGGGIHNPLLLERIALRLPKAQLEPTANYGLDPDFAEAMAFAWLAKQTLDNQPGNIPAVTGAKGPRVLGAIYPA